MGTKLFISYRRADSAGQSGRVHDLLVREFGQDIVFLDVASIPLGANFADHIANEVNSCDAMLAVIGTSWLATTNSTGGRKIEETGDYVRIEIAAALSRAIPVIPLLLDEASMPSSAELPSDIRPLAFAQALSVRHAYFQHDIALLLTRVREILSKRQHISVIVPSFERVLANSWIERISEAVSKGKVAFADDLDEVRSTFGDPVELSQTYIEPEFSLINPADESEEDPITDPRASASEYFKKLFSRAFATRHDGRSVLFVLSDAGMGKTSLLLMLKLASCLPEWPTGIRCVILKLGGDTLKQIADIKDKSATVLLLDALDEDPLAWSDYAKRLQVLVGASIYFYRTILTCRTQFFPRDEVDPFNRRNKIRIDSFICPIVYLANFSDRQVEQYLEKRFPDDPKLATEARNAAYKMGSLRCRPLLLAHIDGILESERVEWTEYSVLEAMTKTWLIREVGKLRLIGWDGTYHDLLYACMHVAGRMQSYRSRTIAPEVLTEASVEFPLADNIRKIDLGGRSLLNKNSDGHYRFSHYLIQEFLISHALIQGAFECLVAPIPFSENIFKFIRSSPCGDALLKYLNFSEAIISDVSFSNISFAQASFSGAKLSRCVFQNCDFNVVSFRGGTLLDCRFNVSRFNSSDLSGLLDSSVAFRDCELPEVDFSSSVLERVRFESCSGGGVNFTNADIEAWTSSDSSFEAAMFSKMCATSFEADGCNFSHTDFEGVEFGIARFSTCDLREGSFTGIASRAKKSKSGRLVIDSDCNKNGLRVRKKRVTLPPSKKGEPPRIVDAEIDIEGAE